MVPAEWEPIDPERRFSRPGGVCDAPLVEEQIERPGPASPTPTRVAICALTYMRPTGLRRLLAGVAALDRPEHTTISVVIVDNDPAESARSIVDEHRDAFPFALHYVPEPRRGIATARNAAVEAARTRADLLAFIDDDEWPDPRWLVELLTVRAATGADVVTGPVAEVFDEPPPAWVLDGKYFARRRHADREAIRYATTSNVLIDLACVPDDPFDTAFDLSGGEDTHLFAELRERGVSIAWADAAWVSESIPPSKVSPRWILRREYRRGQTLSLSMRRRDQRLWRVVRRIGNALVQVAAGTATAIVGVPKGRFGILRGAHRVVFGLGMLTGMLGLRYREYGSTHGG